MAKAKYLYSMGNKYYHSSFFEYRGKEYEVEYSSSYTTFQKSAKQQHIENQKRIDELLDNPKGEEIEEGTFNSDEIFKLLGWD